MSFWETLWHLHWRAPDRVEAFAVQFALYSQPSQQRTGTGVSLPSPGTAAKQAAPNTQEDCRADAQKLVLVAAHPVALLQSAAVPAAAASASAWAHSSR